MKSICIFSGTTEGRNLAELLAAEQIPVVVMVATEYGEMVMNPSAYITVHQGRMDQHEMHTFLQQQEWYAVVDATHPFATEVSRQIKESVRELAIPLFRLQRNTGQVKATEQSYKSFATVQDCIQALLQTQGNILLTTGSKDLAQYAKEDALRYRLFVRVLPGLESIRLCEQAGISGKQVIAMQGPFSAEMNLATIHQYQIAHLVTKESGKTGGMEEKLQAAEQAGIQTYLIKNPEKESGDSFEEVVAQLHAILASEKREKYPMQIALVGVGMGGDDTITVAGEKQIRQADYLFGAPRLLEPYAKEKERYPYYLAKDILPVLTKLREKEKRSLHIVVLFSGDTGFYSGCQKLYQALRQLDDVSVRIFAGVSSVAALSARTGVPWENAKIMSLHGKEKSMWEMPFRDAIAHEDKVFLLLSGKEQVKEIGRLCQKEFAQLTFYIGRQMSYPEETVEKLTAETCACYEQNGLLTCLICNEMPQKRRLTHGLADDVLLRTKVPMTKEEVREVSICKLRLTKEAVVYDIGSGTGSISIEMACLSPQLRVFAIEQNSEAVALLEENKKKFGVTNIEVVHAMAPEGMEELPIATHAFIGGSKGNLFAILERLYACNPKMRVVVNAISMETIAQLQQIEGRFSVSEFQITQLQVSHAKTIGTYHLLQADNPVMICAFTFQE